MRLFAEQGFHETTVEQIAAAAGVSRRTFFRYFDAKSAVLWNEFDSEVEAIRATLAAAEADLPVMQAIRLAVLATNDYSAEDVPELRMRMRLIATVPELAASAAVRYDAWERTIGDFVAERTGWPPGSLYPLAVGRATLAVSRAAYDRWAARATEGRADADLTVYLDVALAALAVGFPDDILFADDARLAKVRRTSRVGRSTRLKSDGG